MTHAPILFDFPDRENLWSLEKALQIQEILYPKTKGRGDPRNYCLFVQHSHMYAFDSSPHKTKGKKLLRVAKEELPAPLIPIERRGGLITYHGPGQLVCYIVIRLQDFKLSIRKLNTLIDESIIRALKHFRIQAHTKPDFIPEEGAGVWITTPSGTYKKIASRGLLIKSGITQFGFALNVNTDLSYFDYIYPCGLDIQITSMKEVTGIEHALPHVFRKLEEEILQKLCNEQIK